MRIHTDTLTESQLYAALPAGVNIYVTPRGSRKRDHAFEVTLWVAGKDDLHRRYGNSGGYGCSTDVAATWDEWGLFIAHLFELEPTALIGNYAKRIDSNPLPKKTVDFVEATRHYRNVVRLLHKPESLAYRTHTAPWLSHGGDGTRGVGSYRIGGIVSARG